MEPPEVFRAVAVTPATPSRAFALPRPPPPVDPPVPAAIPAWKGKVALWDARLLDAVEAAMAAAVGTVQDAWASASEWSRDIWAISLLAKALGLEADDADEMFRDADAIKS